MPWKKVLLEGDAAVLSDTAPTDVDFNAAAAGSATEASRRDHKHDVPKAALGDLAPISFMSGAIGTLNSFVRGDHKHTITRGVVGEMVPTDGQAASRGTSSGLIAVDHRHALGPMTANMNMSGYEMQGLKLQTIASGPGTDKLGLMVFLSGDVHPYVYTG